MRILFVTTSPLEYSTSANIRNIGLIEGLIKNGHEIYTYSEYPSNLSLFDGRKLEIPFVRRYWITSRYDKISSQLSSGIKAKLKGFLFKLYGRFSIYDVRKRLVSCVNADIFKEKYDIMISSSDAKSAHLIAEELFRQDKQIAKRWIQYWGDPLTGDISYKRLVPNIFIKKEEERIISLADKIVYVSPFTAEYERKLHPQCAEKIVFLPIPSRTMTTISHSKSFTYEAGYMGDYHSKNRNILPFYNVLVQMKLKSVIIGNSDMELQSTDEVFILPRTNTQKLKEIENNLRCIVCLCNSHGTQIPGKVYHYVSTNKPILIIVDGEYQEQLTTYFQSFDRFYICKNEKKEIMESLKLIMKDKKQFTLPSVLNTSYIAEKFVK